MKARSEEAARRLGYPILPSLPALFADDEPLAVRASGDVADRALALNAVVAAAFGLPRERARRAIVRGGLDAALTTAERAFLDGSSDGEAVSVRVEALWALVWSLGLVELLDFADYCGDHLASLLPDLRRDEPLDAFRSRARLRAVAELVEAADLAYRLHWAVVDATLRREATPGRVEPYVIVERRRALEWILDAGTAWDDVSLDT